MTSTASLRSLAGELLEQATSNHAHRAARTVFGGRDRTMRQTLIAMAGGSELAEHESPGEATLFVLNGSVELKAGDDTWSLSEGDFVEIPPMRHSVHADGPAVILLTAVPEGHGGN